MRAFSFIQLAMAGLLTCVAASPAWANRYRIVDLGAKLQTEGINDAGVIAAWSDDLHAIVWRGGQWRALDDEDAKSSFAIDVNDLGQVAGYEAAPGVPDWGVVWRPDGAKRVVSIPRSDWNGHPRAISTTGFVAGAYSDPESGETRCFVQRPKGRGIDLGDLGDTRRCLVADVNDLGQVVGEVRIGADLVAHAFLWQHGRMRDLGTLGGLRASANAINDRGQVVGYTETAKSAHAFLWEKGHMKDLGEGDAWSISQRGEIVGHTFNPRTTRLEAVRFTKDGIVYLADEVEDLTGWDWLEYAYAVNDKGEIVGIGGRAGGLHQFLLVPVTAD